MSMLKSRHYLLLARKPKQQLKNTSPEHRTDKDSLYFVHFDFAYSKYPPNKSEYRYNLLHKSCIGK